MLELEARWEPAFQAYQKVIRQFPAHIRARETADWPPEVIQRDARELYQMAQAARHFIGTYAPFHRRAPKQLRKLLKYEARLLHLL
jgi:hypothetical protein